MLITLGNVAPRVAFDHDPSDPVDVAKLERDGGDLDVIEGKRVVALDPLDSHTTVIEFPDDESILNLVPTVAALWAYHSAERPGWVQCDNPLGEALLQEFFDRKPPAGVVALLTNAGKDFACAQLSGSASASAVAKYMALTANSTTPSAGSTALTGEITTAGGGLLRALATYAHTVGTSSYTLTKTFTANGSDSLPVTLAKIGVFDTPTSGGTLVYETLLSATAPLSAIGDQVVVTETVNL